MPMGGRALGDGAFRGPGRRRVWVRQQADGLLLADTKRS